MRLGAGDFHQVAAGTGAGGRAGSSAPQGNLGELDFNQPASSVV
jgi:hypothetical protein